MSRLFGRKKKREEVEAVASAEKGLRERVAALREENNRLERELEGFREREKAIGEVLRFAKERAEEYERESKIRFALENERLVGCREKWKNRLIELGNAEDLGAEIIECQQFFKECCEELTEIASGKIPPQSPPRTEYFREKSRLEELGASEENSSEDKLSEEELKALILQFSGESRR